MLFSQNKLFAMFEYINECLDKSTDAIHLISFAKSIIQDRQYSQI